MKTHVEKKLRSQLTVSTELMKLYLDDERPTPEGWVGVKTYTECVAVLASGDVTHISLDHDLGTPEDGKTATMWHAGSRTSATPIRTSDYPC